MYIDMCAFGLPVGAQARLMSQALRKIAGNASKCNCTVLFLNQLRHKVATQQHGYLQCYCSQFAGRRTLLACIDACQAMLQCQRLASHIPISPMTRHCTVLRCTHHFCGSPMPGRPCLDDNQALAMRRLV